MSLPSSPSEARANEMAVAQDYRREAERFFAAASDPLRSPEEASADRASGADLRALAVSIERHVRGLPGLPPAGLLGA